MEDYAYIFVRQDLSKEQQLVQFGHVCCVLGSEMHIRYDPHKLNFVAIGVKDLEQLDAIKFYLDFHDLTYVEFEEPDIGDQVTAIACLPVSGKTRNKFEIFDTLTLD